MAKSVISPLQDTRSVVSLETLLLAAWASPNPSYQTTQIHGHEAVCVTSASHLASLAHCSSTWRRNICFRTFCTCSTEAARVTVEVQACTHWTLSILGEGTKDNQLPLLSPASLFYSAVIHRSHMANSTSRFLQLRPSPWLTNPKV